MTTDQAKVYTPEYVLAGPDIVYTDVGIRVTFVGTPDIVVVAIVKPSPITRVRLWRTSSA